MALPTPPSSAAKSGKFMEPANMLTTYEDFFSQRNEDEDFDRFPDSCEDETDSDDFDYAERVGVRRADFFARFTNPKGQKAVGQSGLDRSGEVKKGADQSNNFSSKHVNTTSPTDGTNTYETSWSTTYHHPPASPNQGKKLAPKKYGIFSAPAATMRGGLGLNTAGEAMDEMLMDGVLDDLRDGFPTLEQDASGAQEAAPARDVSPEDVAEAFVRQAEEKARRLAPLVEEDDDGDGDVEDNVVPTEEVQAGEVKKKGAWASKPRGRLRNRKPVTNGGGAKKASPAVGVRTSGRVQKATPPDLAPATARYSLRRQERAAKAKEEEARLAKRPATRSMGTTNKAAVLKASNRNKMTARAVTMRKKAKKLAPATTSTKAERQRYSKRHLRQGNKSKVGLRNGKGEKRVNSGAYVLIPLDEVVDSGEYVRYE